MNALRKAAQQALEALEDIFGANKVDVGAITALRAALAEHDKDRVLIAKRKIRWAEQLQLARETRERDRQQREYEEQRLAALAEPVQEPVAWMDIDRDGTRISVRMWTDGNRDEVPLYTAPPQRKPLTEAQIYAAIKGIDSLKAVEVARAIEKAHGIE